MQQVRVESRHLSHREVSNQGTDAERWLPAHIRWDMSANVHPTSPTLSTEEPYVGPMCAHERQALDTDPPGRDWRFQITPA